MEGGVRPNFPPRFDGPNEFYRGPPGPPGGPMGPPGIFDEPPLHPRHRRHDDRRRHRPEFDDEPHRLDKRNQWGNHSPPQFSEAPEQNVAERHEEGGEAPLENKAAEEPAVEDVGNTTPLRDEPAEEQSTEGEPQPVEETNEVVASQENESSKTDAE